MLLWKKIQANQGENLDTSHYERIASQKGDLEAAATAAGSAATQTRSFSAKWMNTDLDGWSNIIKIISYIVIAFSCGKANIVRTWSNILRIFYGNKGLCHCADLIDSDENLHCFTRPLSSCNIKISVVSQCRSTAGISWLFNIWTHSCSPFFNWLTTCTCWGCTLTWSLLKQPDTD